MSELYRAEAMYSNKDFTRYSVKRISDDYLTFSETMAKRYPGYMID